MLTVVSASRSRARPFPWQGRVAGFVTGGYTKLLEDAKRTPLTSIRGDADQWLVGAGLAFTF